MKKHVCQRRRRVHPHRDYGGSGHYRRSCATSSLVHRHDTRRQSQRGQGHVAELESALERFNVHMDRYPTTEEGLKALLSASAEDKKWRGPYIKLLRPESLGQSIPIPESRHPPLHKLSTFGRAGPMALTAARRRCGYWELVNMRPIVGNHNHRLAFTLVELMVVIVLIGIMTAMIIRR